MDLQTTLLTFGVCALTCGLVYLISVFGMKEKTYEQAIEEQRRRRIQEVLQSTKSDKPKKEKKFKKPGGKKSKEKVSDSSDRGGSPTQALDGLDGGGPHQGERVEFKTEAEIIPSDPEAEGKPLRSSKKRPKGPQSLPKSILVNKQEQKSPEQMASSFFPAVEEDDGPIAEPPMPTFTPKDEVERRHSMDLGGTFKGGRSLQEPSQPVAPLKATEAKVDSKKKEERKKLLVAALETNEEIKREAPEPPQAVKLVKEEAVVSSSPSKKSKKAKSEEKLSAIVDGAEMTGKRLLACLKGTQLQDDEIQLLIEVLLNKQHQGVSAEWTKKNDPVAALKKQLQEKEAVLEAEQRQSAAVNVKLKELRQELSLEKSRSLSGDRALKEKLAQQQQELQSLHARLQHAHDQHISETSALQAKLQQVQSKVSEEQNMAFQRITDENGKLQQKLSRLDSERQSWSNVENQLQLQIKQLQAACEHYEASQQQEREKLEGRVQQLMSSQQEEEYKYGQRINEKETLCNNLAQEAQRAVSKAAASEAERSGLVARLEKSENRSHQLEEELGQLKVGLDKEKSVGRDLQGHLERLQAQEQVYAHQSVKINQQTVSLREENERLKGELAKAVTVRTEADGSDNGRLEKQLELQTLEFNKSLKERESQLNSVTEELETQKQKNNELREKNWKAMEALTHAEKAGTEKAETARREAEKKTEEIKAKEEEKRVLERRLQEFRAETDLQLSHAKELSLRVQQEQVKEREALQRLLPETNIDGKLEHGLWLKQFVSSVQQRMNLSADPLTPPISPDVEEKVKRLTEENNSLQAQVTHYKTVLAETEGILQKLECNVEAEVQQWKDKLAEKDHQLQIVQNEKDKLEKNLEDLQSIEEATSEMQSRLKELQVKLQGEESEKRNLESKVEEANLTSEQLVGQLKTSGLELEALRNEKDVLEKTREELAQLRVQLEKERKITKDLSSQTVKLNSLVQIGKDALKAEQELVKEMQRQIELQTNNNEVKNNGEVSIAASNGNVTVIEKDSACVTPTQSIKSDKPSKHKKRVASAKK